MSIKDLKGVGAKTAADLEDAGRDTIEKLAAANPDYLHDYVDSLGEKKAQDIVSAARKELRGEGNRFQSGLDLEKEQEDMGTISTGSEDFDGLLGGGVGVGYLTEAYGTSSSGKCVTGDTPVIYREDGKTRKRPIREVFQREDAGFGETAVEGLETLAYNREEQQLEYQRISKLWKQEVEKTIRVETSNGREIEGTPDHPLLVATQSGLDYKRLEDIEPDDKLATPQKLGFEGRSSLSQDEAYFLGLYTAEGGNNPYAVNTSKQKLVDFVSEFCESHYGFTPSVNDDRILLRESVKDFTGEELNRKSVDKQVPARVFNQSRQTIAAYLAGYLDGDGTKSEDGSLSFTTGSEQLFEDITYLFYLAGFTVSKSARKIEGETYYRGRVKTTMTAQNLPSKLGRDYNESSGAEYRAPNEIRRMLRDFYRTHISQGSGTSKAELPEEGKSVFATEQTGDGVSRESLREASNWLDDLQAMFQELRNESLADGAAFKEAVNKTPMTTGELADSLGLSESALTNYKSRGFPSESRRKEVQSAFRELSAEYEERTSEMSSRVNLMRQTGFDKVTNKEVIEGTKNVYDFVVPESQSFVGGNIPSINHNTQLAHQLAVNNQLDSSPDNGDKVVFIDVEETFRADRIRDMAEAADLDPDETLDNIRIARTNDLTDQEQAVKEIRQLDLSDIGLIVTDSMVGHIRAEFEGRSEYGERSDRLGSILSDLQKIASNSEVAVFYTNQAGRDPSVQYGDPVYAYGGSTMKHRSSFRLRLDSRGSKGFNAELVDSPNLPQRDVYFGVSSAGVVDNDE
jgi:DNA repair protein RadA